MTKKDNQQDMFEGYGRSNVDWNVFAKMYAKDYDTTPFYFTQTSPDGKVRIAFWCCSPRYAWEVAEQVVSEFPNSVDVLFKVDISEEGEEDIWQRYHCADIEKAKVLAAVHRYEQYILADSRNQLCIRRADTGEYIAYDHGGALWLYPADDGKRWTAYLDDRQVPQVYRPLLSDVPHWSRYAAEAEQQQESFILDLGLVAVGLG